MLSEYGERIIQRRNLISFLSTMMSEYGERKKQRRNLNSFLSSMLSEYGERKSKKGNCFLVFLTFSTSAVKMREKEKKKIKFFLFWHFQVMQTSDMSHGGGEVTNTKL